MRKQGIICASPLPPPLSEPPPQEALSNSDSARALVSIVVDIVCALALTLVIPFVGGLARVLVFEIVPVLILLLLIALLRVRLRVHVPRPVPMLVIVRVPVLAL